MLTFWDKRPAYVSDRMFPPFVKQNSWSLCLDDQKTFYGYKNCEQFSAFAEAFGDNCHFKLEHWMFQKNSRLEMWKAGEVDLNGHRCSQRRTEEWGGVQTFKAYIHSREFDLFLWKILSALSLLLRPVWRKDVYVWIWAVPWKQAHRSTGRGMQPRSA